MQLQDNLLIDIHKLNLRYWGVLAYGPFSFNAVT